MRKKSCVLLAIAVILLMCTAGSCDDTSSYSQTAAQNEESVRAVLAGKSLPRLTESLDWDNLKMKYEFLDQRGRIGWVYIFSATGVLIAEEPVLNKMTSNNSYLTPMEEIKGTNSSPITVEAPDLDGTYGENPDGVFWFDPDGIYEELLPGGGIVIYSSERKSYDTPPLLQSHYSGE